MDGYREYLDLFEYFGRGGLPRLTRAEFDALDVEWRALAPRAKHFDEGERARLAELKALLLRDRP